MLSEAKQPLTLSRSMPLRGFFMKSFDCASTPRGTGILRSLWSLRMTLLNTDCANLLPPGSLLQIASLKKIGPRNNLRRPSKKQYNGDYFPRL